MKKVLTFLAIVALVFATSAQAATSNDVNQDYTGMRLNIESVDVHPAVDFSAFKKSGNTTLGGPGPGPGTSNFCMDAYTAPTWATTSPSVFTIEQYNFTGGTAAVVDHRVVVANNQGPWPTPIGLGFAWQACDAKWLYPPLPSTLGLLLDGNTLALTLPYTGIWYITVGISGFSPGTYDWAWFADYTGTVPIQVPPPLTIPGNIDQGGDDATLVALQWWGGVPLYGVSDQIGDGLGANRPWCFQVK